MSYTRKTFEELDIMDDFLMNAVATNQDVGIPFCQKVLSVLLQRKIGKIRVVAQRMIPPLTPELRGIRMDVEVEEFADEENVGEGFPALNIYDLEPHLQKDTQLVRHNRFYQAKIDSRYMKSGEHDFVKLPNLYVITITSFDPFGYDYMMYTIGNECKEVKELDYDDGLQFVYFYTGGRKGGNAEIRAMLQYFQNSKEENVTSEAVREIHEYVKQVKIQPEVKQEYMKFDEIMYYAKRDGKIESIIELLEEHGEVSEELKDRMEWHGTPDNLKRWLKLASNVSTIQEFEQKMD